MVGLTIVVIIFALGAGVLLIAKVLDPKVDTQDPRARALLDNPEYTWTDVLQSHRSEIRFDPVKRVMALLSVHSPPQLVAFSDVREWTYSALPSKNGQRWIGQRFRITTSNPANPITFLDIYARDNTVAELWMAKMNAYING